MTYRINILGQDVFSTRATDIDRTFHGGRLGTRYPSSDWIYFCDQVDAALFPMNDLKKDSTFYACIKSSTVLIAFAMFGTIIVLLKKVLGLNQGIMSIIILAIIIVPFF